MIRAKPRTPPTAPPTIVPTGGLEDVPGFLLLVSAEKHHRLANPISVLFFGMWPLT